MDSKIIDIFTSMDYPPAKQVEKQESPLQTKVELSSIKCGDPASISSEVSRFIKVLEKNRNQIETAEAVSLNISAHQAKKNLNVFIDHLYYYIGSKVEYSLQCPVITIDYIGSVLASAGPSFALALLAGFKIIFVDRNNMNRDEPCPVTSLLSNMWVKISDGHSQRFVDHKLLKETYSHKQGLDVYQSVHLLPLLVLDGADVHSVVQAILEEAYLPAVHMAWRSSFIIIEESQLEKFKTELFHHDVEFKLSDELKKRYKLNNSAEVYYLGSDRSIVFGSAVPSPYSLQSLSEKDRNSPLFVIPVRSALEAVSKANHYADGYAAAVFTEDGSLSQLVSEKLQVSTVWINTIGDQHPAAPLPVQVWAGIPAVPERHSFDDPTANVGLCYLSAKALSVGLFDHFNSWLTTHFSFHHTESSSFSVSPEVADKVKAAVSAQPGWAGMGGLQRSKILFNVFTSCEDRIKSSSSEADDLSEISRFFKETSIAGASTFANQEAGSAITTYLCPVGVVALYVGGRDTSAIDVVKMIQGAIVYGNTCVVLLADGYKIDSKIVDSLYGTSSALPKGVVSIVRASSKDTSHWHSLHSHKEIKSIWLTALFENMFCFNDTRMNDMPRVWAGIGEHFKKTAKTGVISLKTFEPHATYSKYVWRKVNLTYG